tara:strand:+ start:296 stop:544 length:249 start_codon:yes stop_codon:yes gene_type:complete
MDKRVSIGKDLAQISNSLAEGQGLLELNDFEDYEERVAEFELGFDALKKIESYIEELENYCPEDDEEVIQNVLANKGLSDCY